jgi:hypothetical protein
MALVRIVYVPTADLRGPDLDRIGGVEEIPDELARIMVAGGEAVYADGTEVEIPAQQQSLPQVPVVGVPVLGRDELDKLKKDELVEYAQQRGVALESGATKADMVEALAPAEAEGTAG